jgi:hypothetical protein
MVKDLLRIMRVHCLCTAVLFLAFSTATVSYAQQKSAADKEPATKEQKPEATSAQKPAMEIDVIEHDAGEVFEGTLVKHDFTVKNMGKADLLIKKVNPG